MYKYIIGGLFLITVTSTIYAFTIETNPLKIIEKENRQKVIECLEDVHSFTWTANELQKEIGKCTKLELISISWTHSTGITVPPSWFTSKHTLILTGSHDYRIYSSKNWAVWKNNNPSGITWRVSKALEAEWIKSWIWFEKWTYRPKNEWWNYILFSSIEHGLRAKMISIRERWWEANVGRFLKGWWTDDIKLSFSKDKVIKELSSNEFSELFIQQLKKESPWLVSQLVADKILIVN